MNQIRFSDVIDIAAASTAPVAAWTAICQSFGKPWARSEFIALGAVSVTLWLIKTIIRLKKKNARRQPKRSSCDRNISNNSITKNRKKIKCEYKIPVYLREGKGFAYNYKKRDLK